MVLYGVFFLELLVSQNENLIRKSTVQGYMCLDKKFEKDRIKLKW